MVQPDTVAVVETPAGTLPPPKEAGEAAPEYDDSYIPAPPENLRELRREFQANRDSAFRPALDTSILDIARGGTSKSVPVWAMRQAGRYLPEFKQVRSISSFFEVCESPRLAAEVTLQPLVRFPDLSAVIIFSDILVIPVAMGMPCEMIPGQGPVFKTPLDIENPDTLILKPNVENTLGYVFDAIHWTYLRLESKVRIPILKNF